MKRAFDIDKKRFFYGGVILASIVTLAGFVIDSPVVTTVGFGLFALDFVATGWLNA
ncbi:MAG: hypothetical protein JRN39_02520 [Nitrososphaerota archaeon]|nr:hypothetical protein [Nitrososphaerota archaeon]